MRILLIKSRSLQSKTYANTPPLGVLYLASFLRERMGAEVFVVDVLRMDNPALGIADAVRDTRPDMVGISSLACEAFMVHQAVTIIRSVRPGMPIVVGGPYPSSDFNRALSDRNIDVVAIGEGEETLLELAQVIQNEGSGWACSANLSGVRGIAYRETDGSVVVTAPRPLIDNLDSLPPPAWDTIDVRWFWTQRSMSTCGIRPYMPIFTSRGCPYQCTYCHNLFGRRFRARSAASVVDEIAEIHRNYGIRDFEFLDDSANLDKARFRDILNGILERGIHPVLTFPNGVRTDLLDEDLIRLLHKVGAGEVSVAVESASPRIQQLMKKKLDIDKVRQNIELMADLRIFTRGFFMFGYPSETEEEIRATIDFAATSRLHLASFHVTNPFPGTVVHEEFKALGKLPQSVQSIDFEYTGAPFNGSTVPDERFHDLYRLAFLRFYLQPQRIARIIRDRPYWSGYPIELRSFISKFISFKQIRESLT